MNRGNKFDFVLTEPQPDEEPLEQYITRRTSGLDQCTLSVRDLEAMRHLLAQRDALTAQVHDLLGDIVAEDELEARDA